MDIKNTVFHPKVFKAFDRTAIDEKISNIRINVNDEKINYGHINKNFMDDIRLDAYILKPINNFQNFYLQNQNFNLTDNLNSNNKVLNEYKLNMEPIIDLLNPLEYKGVRANYLGNIYDRKSFLTPIDSLPRIIYKKEKFSL